MEKRVLKEVILDQHAIDLPKPFVERSRYLDIKRLSSSKQIAIISGLRRSGKSTLLKQIQSNAKEQDYFINFDDDRLVNFNLADFQILYELFVELYGPQKTFYFDEIQNILEWERFVRRLADAGNKVYITGSNASMLSQELGTRLTGRYLEFQLYPYAFSEFLTYRKQPLKAEALTTLEKGMLKSEFNAFTQLGGLPEYLEQEYDEYLHDLYNSILYRDIIVRYDVKNHQALKKLVYYLASNLAKECTYNSLAKTVGLANASTASEYCGYLQNSFLCYFINRYDYSVKKQIHYAKKVYFIDQALAVNVGFRFSQDQDRLLENIVFLELKRRKQDIYFHKHKKECDFVLRKGTHIMAAIQVCVDIENHETENREISGLIEAMQIYDLEKGLILTQDTVDEKKITIDDKTYHIDILPVWKWLLQEYKE